MLSIESCYALIMKHETVETGPVCDMWAAQHIASITSSMDIMNSVISVDNSPHESLFSLLFGFHLKTGNEA